MADIELSVLGSVIKPAYEGEANTNAYTDAEKAKLGGVEAGATADQSDAEIETAYNTQVAQVSAGEKTAGTETAVRRFSPKDVADMRGTRFLGSDTVAGSARTTLTVSGLDLSAFREFHLVAKLKNATASLSSISMFYNGDTTTGNYHRTSLVVTSSVSGVQSNDAIIMSLLAGTGVHATFEGTIINGVGGRPRAMVYSSADQTSNQRIGIFNTQWVTAANVTSIVLSASITNSLDIGSTFSVFGVN